MSWPESTRSPEGAALTSGKANVLAALRRVTADGWPASVREVMLAAGLSSPSTAHYHLVSLEARGLARHHPRRNAGGWLAFADHRPVTPA